jgi:UDP-glucose 4-epimerase
MAFADNLNGEVINVGPDEEFVTINELAEIIARKLNFKLDPMYLPPRPAEVKFATCSAGKARKLLGYQTKYTLDQGITDMIEYIRKRGTRRFRYHLDIELRNRLTPKSWTEKLF